MIIFNHIQSSYKPKLSDLDAPLNILLVEDSVGDEILTRKAIDATHVEYNLKHIRTGTGVMPYLSQCYDLGLKIPDLMLLDLGLPGIDGFMVLSQLELAPISIRVIPIIVLTGYKDFSDICRTYDLPLFAYLPKPCRAETMKEMLTAMKHKVSCH